MASKLGRKGRSKTTCPEKERNMEHQTHLGLSSSSKTLPTILSDTSPQEEMAEETRQLTNKSEAVFNSEEEETRQLTNKSKADFNSEEEGERVVEQKSRRLEHAREAQEETLYYTKGLSVRNLYRYWGSP